MRITREVDYAIRILAYLAKCEDVVIAKTISEKTNVTQRFTLKILQKLIHSELVRSYRGAYGGYQLNKDPQDINMRDIIEIIDGEIQINSCLKSGHICSYQKVKEECKFHQAFTNINQDLRDQLKGYKLNQFIVD